VTPLNFVCKARDPLPRRERGGIFAKARAAKFFRRVRAQMKICSCCRSADETRVFVASHRVQLCRTRARHTPLARAFAGAMTAQSGGFTTPKKFCGKGLRKACWRAFRGAKRANRADRFALAPPQAAVSGALQRPRVGDFRRRFDRRRALAPTFSARVAATNGALRCRDAS
jgi:hypothetical protein